MFERTAGARGRVRKVMAVAPARKLLVALRQTGEVPAGAVIVKPAVTLGLAA